jgi:hypothetical protein
MVTLDSTFLGENRGVLNTGIDLDPTRWTFLAATYEEASSKMTFFVDGMSFIYTNTNFGNTSHNFFDIGNSPSFGYSWNGLIDEVFVFDETLTEHQIDGIRAAGVRFVPEPCGLVVGILMMFSCGLCRTRNWQNT